MPLFSRTIQWRVARSVFGMYVPPLPKQFPYAWCMPLQSGTMKRRPVPIVLAIHVSPSLYQLLQTVDIPFARGVVESCVPLAVFGIDVNLLEATKYLLHTVQVSMKNRIAQR
mmetsp:Transcript_39800/g.99614  ORF Transcript_39800/g.99614 Transcript_39800/m.99614 type:complete len:112 (-) Transcript_39800:683-1018(-)